MSSQTITPCDVFSDQSLADILAWSHHARYHDVFYYNEKNLIVSYLEPTTYSVWLIYEICQSDNLRFHQEYLSHLTNMGYNCVYLQSEFSDLSMPLRTAITMGHIHDMFTNTRFTHRCVL